MNKHWLSREQQGKRLYLLAEFAELMLEVSNLTFYLRRHTLQSEEDTKTVKATFERCHKRLKELENAYNDIYSGSDFKGAAVQKDG